MAAAGLVAGGVLPAVAAVSTTAVVSYAPDGSNANSDSVFPSVSADGRYVAFESDATDLVAGDTNSQTDIFVRDLTLGTTVRASVAGDESEEDGSTGMPSISADGRYVAFQSFGANLVAGDANSTSDIFVRDLTLDTTVRVSVADDESEANSASYTPSISGDGRYVAFESNATNLSAVDANSQRDVFVRDLTLGTTVRVSVSSDESEANGFSYGPSISASGLFVAFQSDATNLVVGDTAVGRDVFLRDITAGTTVRVSVAGDESEGDSSSFNSSVSGDGRYVAFHSYATNLVADDTNSQADVFVRDLTLGTTVRISVNAVGVQGNFGSEYPSISADGQHVAFSSAATNLTTVTDLPADTCDADGPVYADDTNCRYDVFVHGAPVVLPPTGKNPNGVLLVAFVLLAAGTCALGLRRARTA